MEFPGEKLIIKMWETIVDKGIGGALRPWHEKQLGRARIEVRRDEMLMLAEAEAVAQDIKAGRRVPEVLSDNFTPCQEAIVKKSINPKIGLDNLIDQAGKMEASEAIRKEVNVSRAILVAESVLQDEGQQVEDKAVEDDWLYTWRDNAGRVSSAELQDLWGRILAGEVKSPGSYSLRTMEFLKNLSKGDAEIIGNLAQFVIDGCITRGKDDLLEKAGIDFGVLLFLQEIGVLSGVEAVGLSIEWSSVHEDRFLKSLVSNKKAIIIEHEDKGKVAAMQVYQITNVGKEVLALASFEANEGYLLSVAKDFAKQGFSVRIGDWKRVTANKGRIFNAVSVQA